MLSYLMRGNEPCASGPFTITAATVLFKPALAIRKYDNSEENKPRPNTNKASQQYREDGSVPMHIASGNQPALGAATDCGTAQAKRQLQSGTL